MKSYKKKSYKFIIASFLVSIFILVSLFGPYFTPYDPYKIDVKEILLPPTKKHIFGTDQLGRDVFSRVIYGSRVSLLVGFIAVSISTIIGTLLGAISGYYGGFIDSAIMRVVDIMLCFPTFFLILAVVAFLEPGIYKIMIVIGATNWMGVARIIRAEFLSLKERDFVLAAKALGASDKRIITKHLLPNVLGPILVSATLGIASAILLEASLSFLGLGVQPPKASWGTLIAQGKDNIEIGWWLSLFPGLFLFITVFSFHLLGEAFQERFPRR